MRTIQSIAELRAALAALRAQEKRIGFVPTMGALHDGHLSLVSLSKHHTDVTVVSIFVNPTQFAPNEDFSKYPRTLDDDTSKLVDADVEFLFLPDASEIYPDGASTLIHVDGVTSEFEGAIRPTHFDGVATVVCSLFNIVQPDAAFFGQKDAQQVAVIKRMVRDLHIPVEIVVGETIRESGTLAMSSRNRYLSEAEREQSSAVSETLFRMSELIAAGESVGLAKMRGIEHFRTAAPHAILDYLDIVDSETFQRVTSFDGADAGVVAVPSTPEPSGSGDPSTRDGSRTFTIVIAARFGATRLLDNLVVRKPS